MADYEAFRDGDWSRAPHGCANAIEDGVGPVSRRPFDFPTDKLVAAAEAGSGFGASTVEMSR